MRAVHFPPRHYGSWIERLVDAWHTWKTRYARVL